MMPDFDPIAAGGVAVGAATQSGAAVPVSQGGFAGGNPPGFDATTAAAATQQTGMTTRAQGYANDMYPLFKAQQELAQAPTGKGSDAAYDASALMSTYTPAWMQKGLSFITPIMTPDETTHYAETNKYLTQAQLGVSGATRSNEGGQTASAASPSVLIPKPAAQAVLRGMIGLRRMEQDQTIQWQQSGLPVQALPGFVSKFQTNADPRVYVWDQLPAPERHKILDKMPAAQRSAFMSRVQQADKNGIYNMMGMDAPTQ